MDDREIIDMYFAKDENAIKATSRKYGRLVKSISYNILGNLSDSEECENDTYLALWEKIPPERPESLSAYLGRIARNISINKYEYNRAKKRSRNMEEALDELGEMVSGKDEPEKRLERAEIARAIECFLAKKSKSQRIVFVRRYWYSESVPEISKRLGFSESKIKSMLMRMRKELKIYLERNGITL